MTGVDVNRPLEIATVGIPVGGIPAFERALSTLVSQMWAGVDCSYHFQRIRDLRHFRRRRKAFQRGREDRVGLRRAGGQIDGFALVSECGVAPNHERATKTREVGCQALCDPVDEMLLLRVSPDIGERQDDHRKARRGGFFGREIGAGFAWAGWPTSTE